MSHKFKDDARFQVRGDHVYYAGVLGSQHAFDAGVKADFAAHTPSIVDGAHEEALGELVWKAPMLEAAAEAAAKKPAPKKPAAKKK